jgi:hypothetical protein
MMSKKYFQVFEFIGWLYGAFDPIHTDSLAY